MKIKLFFFFSITALSAAFCPGRAATESRIFIPGEQGESKPIPVSMSGFSGEVSQVLQFDLYVMGFIFTSPDTAQYLISGSNNGNVPGRLTDPHNQSTKFSKAYSGASLRRLR